MSYQITPNLRINPAQITVLQMFDGPEGNFQHPRLHIRQSCGFDIDITADTPERLKNIQAHYNNLSVLITKINGVEPNRIQVVKGLNGLKG